MVWHKAFSLVAYSDILVSFGHAKDSSHNLQG
jgi:hypothetical protein